MGQQLWNSQLEHGFPKKLNKAKLPKYFWALADYSI